MSSKEPLFTVVRRTQDHERYALYFYSDHTISSGHSYQPFRTIRTCWVIEDGKVRYSEQAPDGKSVMTSTAGKDVQEAYELYLARLVVE